MSQPKNQNDEFKPDQTISDVREKEREREREREREVERERGRERESLQREKERDKGFTMPVPNHFIDQRKACLAR